MRAVSTIGVILAIGGLAPGGFLVLAALVELATGKPPRRKLRRPGRRAATLSMFCMGLGLCIIDLTIATG